MARRVITTVRINDDFDHTELREDEVVPVEFIFEGTKYVIDTNKERAEEFRAFLTPWMEVSKDKEKVRLESKKKSIGTKAAPLALENSEASSKRALKRQRDAVREWARENKLTVGPRRISQDILDAYAAATGIVIDGGWGQGGAISRALDEEDEEPPAPSTELVDGRVPPPGHFLPGANTSGVNADMRAWAKAKGITVKGGYVSREYQQQYIDEMNLSPDTSRNGAHV